MGEMEERNRRRVRRGEIQKLILNSVKVVGLLSVGLMAPNVIGAMDKLGLIKHKRQDEVVKSSASKLAKKGLLKFNGKFYELTPAGENKLKIWEIRDHKLPRPRKWDRKWRVIIFDIPERKKTIRERIRNLFESAGFYRLQDSVWVYPYDCEDIIGLLKTDFGVGKDILYIIADEIENDKYLRDWFNII